ncbi:hypothetical protein HMPREF9244_00963 [Alloscardovia omnicolens F0580]|uniref:Uncharacterized protein n=1 Tax=Alloscardovia omnicolens F0580 TaxID=1321816 RepID=U1SEV6_9BIFI|nr:hypothetical protein HMPREF9244_00963 [Alloscardovia omnicolens F0580]
MATPTPSEAVFNVSRLGAYESAKTSEINLAHQAPHTGTAC